MRGFVLAALMALIALASADQPAGPAKNPGDVNIRSNLNVNGTVSAVKVVAGSARVTGDAEIGTVTSSRVAATLVSADVIETGVLRSATGSITVDANLVLSSSSGGAQPVSFLATDVIVEGVRQWRLLEHDDFESNADGWSMTDRTSCSGSDFFLGGHCKFGKTAVTKRFAGLPPHSQVRVAARVHFLDSWNDEAAFLKLDDRYVWADTCSAAPAGLPGLNMCGGDAPDRKFAVPVDATLAHDADSIEVTFGSTQENEDACAQSWGVDDVMVFIR